MREKHFVIAEENKDDLDWYVDAIEETGLPITITSMVDCDQIFSSLSGSPLPDTFIVNDNLPGKSLKECIGMLKGDERLKKVPIVVLSDLDSADSDREHIKGINLFLKKSTHLSDMIEIFRRLYLINWKNYSAISSEDFHDLPF